MKVKELIKALQKLPEERQDVEAKLYISGRLSGFLAIDNETPIALLTDGKVAISSKPTWRYDDQ